MGTRVTEQDIRDRLAGKVQKVEDAEMVNEGIKGVDCQQVLTDLHKKGVVQWNGSVFELTAKLKEAFDKK